MPVHIQAPSSPGKQSTSKLPSCEAALGSSACPRVHLFELPCLQTGRKAGQVGPKVRLGCLEPSYFSEPDHVLKQRCESFFSAHTAKAPASPLPHPIPYLSGPQPQQCLSAMVQTRLSDKSFIFFFLSSPWCWHTVGAGNHCAPYSLLPIRAHWV